MIRVTVRTRDGEERAIQGRPDVSLMQAMRNAGIHELMAICGGGLSCATCHIYVDDAFLDRVRAMEDDEDDLLDASPHRTAASRLSCQIRLAPELDGLRVTVAPED